MRPAIRMLPLVRNEMSQIRAGKTGKKAARLGIV
jgi:hypothetical protein